MAASARVPLEQAGPRMAPLAKLPIFLDLAGRRAIVAGGTAAAAWKAELLAACGAEVVVLTERPEGELLDLVSAAGNIALEPRAWVPNDLADASIAILAARDDIEAASFAAAARALGVPVNVIDRPAFCDFQFGAIVNRSPVVVGISTDGAAPILGQAIRRRIETLLPAGLAAWAAAAGQLRDRIAAELPAPQLRRAFWERFVDIAFAKRPGRSPVAQLVGLLAAGRDDPPAGRVSLVGAGPGDAELLTLKAIRALQAADVILFDELVPSEVLDLARREAKRMCVGKRGGRPSCNQDDINVLMIRLARGGSRVVRLKGGDPMLFGRAGEEIAVLTAAGIPVDVVPGITAGLALAATLGATLTRRDLAHSVRFVTGHGRNGDLPADLDWAGLADPETTLLVYMGGRTAGLLAARLLAEGLLPDTPACAVAALTRPEEARWTGPLETLADGVAILPPGQPMLIGIGHVFAELAVARQPSRTARQDEAEVLLHMPNRALTTALELADPS
jgi:uroporphyrin-III C-methyltransferase/precorrin-2 dehydrogenase/sirohydrochlorin ferrochelatase